MILRKWESLHEDLKIEEIRTYYKILEKKKISLILKRFFDILFSLLLLIILSPLFIILAILIKIDSNGPVFYRQERVTKYKKLFQIFKFRTMVQNADSIGSLVTIENDTRITRVGNLIRKYRLDELPQLINVLNGDMSFVGTRPEVKKYVDEYTDKMKATLLMPAGVTSYASIKFKDEDEILEECVRKAKEKEAVYTNVDYTKKEDSKNYIDKAYIEEILPQKMKYNLEYIKDFNILKDFKICIDTVIGVIKK